MSISYSNHYIGCFGSFLSFKTIATKLSSHQNGIKLPFHIGDFVLTFHFIVWVILSDFDSSEKLNECSSETRRQL